MTGIHHPEIPEDSCEHWHFGPPPYELDADRTGVLLVKRNKTYELYYRAESNSAWQEGERFGRKAEALKAAEVLAVTLRLGGEA